MKSSSVHAEFSVPGISGGLTRHPDYTPAAAAVCTLTMCCVRRLQAGQLGSSRCMGTHSLHCKSSLPRP